MQRKKFIPSSATKVVNSSNQTYHFLKKKGFRGGKKVRPSLEIVTGNWDDKYALGRPLKGIFLTANQIVRANNDVMMVNLRDT